MVCFDYGYKHILQSMRKEWSIILKSGHWNLLGGSLGRPRFSSRHHCGLLDRPYDGFDPTEQFPDRLVLPNVSDTS